MGEGASSLCGSKEGVVAAPTLVSSLTGVTRALSPCRDAESFPGSAVRRDPRSLPRARLPTLRHSPRRPGSATPGFGSRGRGGADSAPRRQKERRGERHPSGPGIAHGGWGRQRDRRPRRAPQPPPGTGRTPQPTDRAFTNPRAEAGPRPRPPSRDRAEMGGPQPPPPTAEATAQSSQEPGVAVGGLRAKASLGQKRQGVRPLAEAPRRHPQAGDPGPGRTAAQPRGAGPPGVRSRGCSLSRRPRLSRAAGTLLPPHTHLAPQSAGRSSWP